MTKRVVYRGTVLGKGSQALELWEEWQKETKDRNAAQKKLDQHMKELEARTLALQGAPLPEHLANYRIGDHPEDWK